MITDLDVGSQLRNLGVVADTLSDSQRRQLDGDGFVRLPGVLSPGEVDQLRATFDRLVAEEGEHAGSEVHQEPGTARLADLVNKGMAFDRCWTEPRQLAAVGHVLAAPFKLSSLNARAALPGGGRQGLHADWHHPPIDGAHEVCNSFWMLDDYTEHNGSTRVVPGSHRFGALPADALDDVLAPHPDEVLVTGTAGTLVVVNSHVWHGGTTNRTDRPRRGLHGYFTRRHNSQQTNQRTYIRPDVRRRLSPAQRHLLDV